MTLAIRPQQRKIRYWVIRPSKYVLIYGTLFWWLFVPPGPAFYLDWQLRQFLSALTSVYIPVAVVLVVANYATVFWLKRARPLYRWRFGGSVEHGGPPENVIGILVRMRHIGLANLALIMFNIPAMALMEEMTFRWMPTGYVISALLKIVLLIGSGVLLFGIVHLSSGYDLATVVVLTVLSAGPLTVAYALGGIPAAVDLHVVTNLIALPLYGGTHNAREPFERFLRRMKLIPQA